MAGWEGTSYSQDPVFSPHPQLEDDESSRGSGLWLVQYQTLDSSKTSFLLDLFDLYTSKHKAVPTIFTYITCSQQNA